MMNWMDMSTNMMKTYMNSQQQMWKSWMDTMQNMTQTKSQWEQSIETWEESVMNMLDIQTEWMNNWFANMAMGDNAENYQAMMQNMVTTWHETQKTMWANWFNMMKQADPEKMMSGEMGDDPFKMWNDQMKNVMSMQQEWTQTWINSMQDTEKDEA